MLAAVDAQAPREEQSRQDLQLKSAPPSLHGKAQLTKNSTIPVNSIEPLDAESDSMSSETTTADIHGVRLAVEGCVCWTRHFNRGKALTD